MVLNNEFIIIVRPRNKSGKEGRGHHQDDLHRPSVRSNKSKRYDENNVENLHFSKQFRVDLFSGDGRLRTRHQRQKFLYELYLTRMSETPRNACKACRATNVHQRKD